MSSPAMEDSERKSGEALASLRTAAFKCREAAKAMSFLGLSGLYGAIGAYTVAAQECDDAEKNVLDRLAGRKPPPVEEACDSAGCGGCMTATRLCLYQPGEFACVRGDRDPCEGCEHFVP